jgi:hypothetical protein
MASEVVRDFIAGSVGGFAGKLFDYPLDTVKVLLQTQGESLPAASVAQMSKKKMYRGAWDCLQKTVEAKGVLSLYKGISSPLLGCMAENAVLFWAYNKFKKVISGSTDESNVPIIKLSIAGAGAGAVVSFVLTPVELVKCRLQVQNASNGNFRVFTGPIDVIVQTVKSEGIVRGLFRGHLSTMYREIPGNFCYFGTYELVCTAMIPEGGSKSDLSMPTHLLGGVLSGISYWTAFFPADTVKSLMQTRPDYGDRTFTDVFKAIYRSEGVAGLYRGWGITVARGAPANALIFAGYEYTSKMLR